jgi:hypothetical protein
MRLEVLKRWERYKLHYGLLRRINIAISFSKILLSYLMPMLTKVSYSQDGSDTNSLGTPDYPSGIPDMHTIHDPMISVSWIHISELIPELHHPLQYRIIVLQLVTWPSLILPRRASLQLSSGYQAALMTHVMPTTLQATNWETFLARTGVVETPHHHPHNLLHNLAKLIARDKAVSTFWIILANHLRVSD